MTLYSIILVIHITAVLVLCAMLSVEVFSLVHLRGASTFAEAHPWIETLPRQPLFAVGSILLILFSGVFLVIQESASGRAWPKVAAATLLLMAPFGAITSRRMRTIRKAYVEKAFNSELLDRLQDPLLKISLSVRIAVFFGIFLLVSAKPGLWESIGLVVTFVVLGLLLSRLAWRRSTSLSAPSADLGD
jgi:cation transport ATPase